MAMVVRGSEVASSHMLTLFNQNVEEILTSLQQLNAKVQEQLNIFAQRQMEADIAMKTELIEYNRDPEAYRKKHHLATSEQAISHVRMVVTLPVELAFNTTKQQMELTTRAIDLVVKNSEAFVTVQASQYSAYVQMRIQDLSVLDKQLDIGNKQQAAEYAAQASKLKLKIDREEHEFGLAERSFRMNLDKQRTEEELRLSEEKLKLEREIQRKKLVLEEGRLKDEHAYRIQESIHKKEVELKQLEIDLKKAKLGRKPEVETEQAAASRPAPSQPVCLIM